MSFKVIEKFILGKSRDISKCEDRIVVTDHFACLIDGATSKSDIDFDSKTQGVIAGELIEKVVRSMPNDITLPSFISEINKQFHSFYAGVGMTDHMEKHPVDKLNASLIIYSDHHNEVWSVGDCQAIIDNTFFRKTKIIDTILSDLRAFITESCIRQGMSTEELQLKDTGREKILEYLKEQTLFQNHFPDSMYSYGVLDGSPIAPTQVENISLTGSDSPYLILATDGYPKLFPSLSESEAYLEYILKNDPLCYHLFKSTKGLKKGNNSFDDRAFIKIERLP